MPVVLSMYGGLGLGLALNPTPNTYQKPRAPLYPGAGVTDEHNKANVAQQSHKIILKLFRLQSRLASKYGFFGHRIILNLVCEATVAYSISIYDIQQIDFSHI